MPIEPDQEMEEDLEVIPVEEDRAVLLLEEADQVAVLDVEEAVAEVAAVQKLGFGSQSGGQAQPEQTDPDRQPDAVKA